MHFMRKIILTYPHRVLREMLTKKTQQITDKKKIIAKQGITLLRINVNKCDAKIGNVQHFQLF